VCNVDADCGGFGIKCSAGKCVTCASDADCANMGNRTVCNAGLCEVPCVDNFDCNDFFACTGGKCAFAGCTTDKQCAVSLKDVRARCDPAVKTCFIGCGADSECNQSLTNGAWFGLVCSSAKRCENVGCDTDADCQLFLPKGTAGQCVTPPKP
jgi:hypothetical protein